MDGLPNIALLGLLVWAVLKHKTLWAAWMRVSQDLRSGLVVGAAIGFFAGMMLMAWTTPREHCDTEAEAIGENVLSARGQR